MERQNSRITRKMLVDWAGEDILRRAQGMIKEGLVLKAEFNPPNIEGAILCNNRELKTGLRILPDGHAENRCPCYDNTERGLVCAHVIALALTIVERTSDPLREAKHKEEVRRASRIEQIDDTKYIQRVPPDAPGAIPANLRISLPDNWEVMCAQGSFILSCNAFYNKTNVPLNEVSPDIPLSFDQKDATLLFVLEDISEGPAKGKIELNPPDFINVIRLRAGREIECGATRKIFVNETEISTHLKLELDKQTGELLLFLHTELPYMDSSEKPVYIVSGKSGWVYGAGNLWPMEKVLPVPYHQIYRGPIRIARKDVIRFMDQEIPLLTQNCRIETEVFRDLFTTGPARPEFRLQIKGSPAALAATLYASYDGIEIVACKPDPAGYFAIPDPQDLMHYGIRNIEMENNALALLIPCGFRGSCGDDLSHIDTTRGVLNFLGTSIPMLRRHGWRVELEGRVAPYMETISHATPVVHISDSEGGGWFDVSFDFEDRTGSSLSQAEIHNAIRKGESFIKRGENIILIDTDAVESMQNVFSDCASIESDEPGHFRMKNIYTPFVKSSLEALDGIDIEDPPTWRTRAEIYNRNKPLENASLEPFLEETLRPYQKEGVHWMRFMKHNGFCGILADEMGLGKTIQTLAWISSDRKPSANPSMPAIIICPTSIVENWADEIRKFVPHLRPLVMSGSDRHSKWDDIRTSDIVITSYALLRRDLDEYLKFEFSTAVLDEAQHIKNRSTQNAVAAKKLRALHRLVLTGTPVENSIADLWSIMDFLMPGYLGIYDGFRQNYELPVSRGGPEAEAAQIKLKRKLHPFLMRRLKTTVAKDLPGKIEKIFPCPMSGDQQRVYEELLRNSRQKISKMVAQNGFNKSRMEIFTLLLRLRQASCHLDLLNLPGLKPEYPSGKMNVFFELMDEAMDSGHRILVFSQFVSMLKILSAEMDRRKIEYCYLDGATKDRIAIVKQFNTQREIPAFLISLKAGGTGLNLTGADMVVHFDPWWNPAVENQATDRAHRIGQKNTVYSIKLISKGTVEEKVLEMQNRKKAVIQATIESDQESFNKMTWEEVQDILSL